MKHLKKYETENKLTYSEYFLMVATKSIIILGYHGKSMDKHNDEEVYIGNLLYIYDGELEPLSQTGSYNPYRIDRIDKMTVYKSANLNDVINEIPMYWNTISYKI